MKSACPVINIQIKSSGEKRTIPGNIIYVGRSSRCTLVFNALPQHKRISRFHAILLWDHGGWYLADLNSKNGTLLNGIRIPEGQIILLQEHDIITLASTETILYICGALIKPS